MKVALLLVHAGVSVALIVLILLQSSQGGLGSAFGGMEFYRTKRGAEKVVFMATIIFAFIFLILSIANLSIGY